MEGRCGRRRYGLIDEFPCNGRSERHKRRARLGPNGGPAVSFQSDPAPSVRISGNPFAMPPLLSSSFFFIFFVKRFVGGRFQARPAASASIEDDEVIRPSKPSPHWKKRKKNKNERRFFFQRIGFLSKNTMTKRNHQAKIPDRASIELPL